MALSSKQMDAINSLRPYAGETVNVLTSQNFANVDRAFVDSAVGGIFNASTLRSLEEKGFLTVANSFWKGATIHVRELG